MPNISNTQRQQRKERVLLIVQQAINGISESEITDQFQHVEQRTINTYLRELSDEGHLYKEGKLWFALNHRSIVLSKFELSAEEAMTLYLASRLLVKHTDRRNEIAETVLHKMARILHSDAGVHESIVSSAEELVNRPEEDNYQDTYRMVMRSALYKVPLEINYRPHRNKSFTTLIHPYLIEPSGLGYATYVIGHNVDMNTLRTYKLERIQHAKIHSGEKFDIPANFPGIDILKNAWSIFHGDETISVALRFHPDVVQRVRETNWHPSMQLIEDNRYLVMTLQVADTTDLKPWIRGWGANCEVLEPIELREEMEGEAHALAKLYGMETNSDNAFDDIFGD